MASLLKDFMTSLATEVGDSQTYRNIVNTLLAVFRNIDRNPNEPRYYILRMDCPRFLGFWQYNAARSFLRQAGWKERKGDLVLTTRDNVSPAIGVLLGISYAVKPTKKHRSSNIMKSAVSRSAPATQLSVPPRTRTAVSTSSTTQRRGG